MKSQIEINNQKIGFDKPTYFIADIAANHDNDIEKAKDLIYLCAESGADAAKFQHFSADTIVSDYGYKSLGSQKSHQAKWKKSVFEVYQDAAINPDWTEVLKETCDKAGITFFTSPYSFDLVDAVDPYVPAYKIGSGDITWLEIIKYMALKGKPILLATGASSEKDVRAAVDIALSVTKDIVLMQCNTNYTASVENFKFINLNVLKTYKHLYPDIILGLSDHTKGHTTVLGAVALGARVIEKHFTDNTAKKGPDHAFSMDPKSWKRMVNCTRELEYALGSNIKKVEDNEKETVILQRRSIRLSKNLSKGDVITSDVVEFLRPCPDDALPPYCIDKVVGRTINNSVKKGECLYWKDLG
jgi:N-acetylneuraminate synthase